MQTSLMDHGGHHHHMAAMGPHPRQQSTQQSTNIICNGSTSLIRLAHRMSMPANNSKTNPIINCFPNTYFGSLFLMMRKR